MTTIKRPSTTRQAKGETGPIASRPRFPPGYGTKKDKKGLLPWSHVQERMANAMHYWVCTVGPDGRPHARPVDGLWLDDRLYFGGSTEARWNRNLAANSTVSVHLESATDVVILHGEAHELRAPERSFAVRLAEASKAKYGFSFEPDQIGTGGTFEFRSRVVFAWKSFPKDATRWEFPSGDRPTQP